MSRWILLLLLPGIAAAAPVPEDNSLVTVAPAPRASGRLNPGKGWSAGGLPEKHPRKCSISWAWG